MIGAYQLALLGEPPSEHATAVEGAVAAAIAKFGLHLGAEVGWSVRPDSFRPGQTQTAAALFFGGSGVPLGAAAGLASEAVPVIPVVSSLSRISLELPPELRALNCLAYSDAGPARLATALLECAGLLPRQRRVFLSYRRDEARIAASQLFDELSARQYDVFLDAYAVAPGEHFQAVLWDRLCDTDVLLMLDTEHYFASRWTSAEFGRALAKSISVLSVGWPGLTPSPRTAMATRVSLSATDLVGTNGMIAATAVEAICSQLELVRTESIAVRRVNLVSNITGGMERIGGKFDGVGMGNGIYLRLPDERRVVAYPVVGVPTSRTLHDAILLSPGAEVAVVYDDIGLSDSWRGHLDWLGEQIAAPRWVKATRAGWDFADWRAPT